MFGASPQTGEKHGLKRLEMHFNHNLFLIIMYHTAQLWRDISIAYLVVFVSHVLCEQPLQPFDI